MRIQTLMDSLRFLIFLFLIDGSSIGSWRSWQGEPNHSQTNWALRPALRGWPILGWLVAAFTALTACNLASEPPALLQVRLPTPSPTPTPAGAATLPPSVFVGHPTDATVSALLDQVQNDRLMFSVSALVEKGTRHVFSAKDNPRRGIGAARDWLLGQFEHIRAAHPAKPIQVWTQPVHVVWRGQQTITENIVIVLPGSDVGAGVLVVGAHYDSIGTPPDDGSIDAPGANDNASGVAALLEIAHILAGQTHRATLMLVAFTAEETGRQGSLAFVESYLRAQDPPIDVRGMINLDMIGSERGPGRQRDSRLLRLFSAEPNDSPSRQLARQVALIIATYVEEVTPVLQSAEERTGRWGDHQSFSAAGYASMRFIQGLEDHTRQHNARDTLDNVQLDYLMRTTRAALAAVSVLATGPLPPTDLALRPESTSPNARRLTWQPAPSSLGSGYGYLVALRRATSLHHDMLLTVAPGNNDEGLTWDRWTDYDYVAIASVDAAGRMGPMTAEQPIAALLRGSGR